MTTEDEPHGAPSRPPRHRTESDEPSDTAPDGEPRAKRDERWEAAQADHWHHAGYTSETQARSDTEDRT